MATISLNFRKEAYAQETGRVPIVLMTLEHEDLVDPIRISSDPTQRIIETDNFIAYGTISRGNTFVFTPARIKLPDDLETGPGEMQIEIDNVDRALTEAIRDLHTPIKVKTEIVMDNALDTVDLVWPEFQMINIRYDASTVTALLSLDNLMREPFPYLMATPSTTPGLFL